MSQIIHITDVPGMRLFIHYIKDRYRIPTRMTVDACQKRRDLMVNAKAVVCDDPEEDCPIKALIKDMETIFRIFHWFVLFMFTTSS